MRHGFTDGLYHSFCTFARCFEDFHDVYAKPRGSLRGNAFLSYFLRCQKVGSCRGAAKDLILLVGICYFCVLIRGLQTLEASLKGFNCCGGKLPLRCAGLRFAEPRCSLQSGRFSCFSLVRKEPKVHQRFANLWTPGTIQIAGRYGVFAKVTGFHQVTGNAENSSFPGIAGNDLNRCDAPALQHKIRAKIKRIAVFFGGQ